MLLGLVGASFSVAVDCPSEELGFVGEGALISREARGWVGEEDEDIFGTIG